MSATRTLLGVLAIGAVAVGCEAIVGSAVPDFQCADSRPSSCPSGMLCDTASGHCVSDTALGDGGGDGDLVDGDVLDGAADGDGATGPAPVGSACRIDGDCQSNLCGTSTILTTTITQGTGPVCTKTCCVSADCPSGFVCFSGGTGGSYCAPAGKAQRTPPATGGKAPGANCAGSTECRSGYCNAGRCVDTCCMVTDCAAGTTCRVTNIVLPAPAHDTWACAPPPPGATQNAGATCTNQGDCLNDNCVGSGLGRVCRPSCCNKQDCVTQLANGSAHCAYSTSGTDQLKFCFLTTNTSGLANGKPCGTNSECQSDYCDAEQQKCLSICCDDSDCTATEVCRPSGVSTPFLRCVAR